MLASDAKSSDESTAYIFEHAMRIGTPDFAPTDEDILRFRNPTTDMAHARYVVSPELEFQFVDIGGQRKPPADSTSTPRKSARSIPTLPALLGWCAICCLRRLAIVDRVWWRKRGRAGGGGGVF